MMLYEFLQETYCTDEIDWKKYQDGSNDYIEDEDLLDDWSENGYIFDDSFINSTWEEINEWVMEEADNCTEDDAALILRLLNDTLLFVQDVKDELSTCAAFYARCYMFVKSPFMGNDILNKCRFTVNRALSQLFWCERYEKPTLASAMKCNPDTEEWSYI